MTSEPQSAGRKPQSSGQNSSSSETVEVNGADYNVHRVSVDMPQSSSSAKSGQNRMVSILLPNVQPATAGRTSNTAKNGTSSQSKPSLTASARPSDTSNNGTSSQSRPSNSSSSKASKSQRALNPFPQSLPPLGHGSGSSTAVSQFPSQENYAPGTLVETSNTS